MEVFEWIARVDNAEINVHPKAFFSTQYGTALALLQLERCTSHIEAEAWVCAKR